MVGDFCLDMGMSERRVPVERNGGSTVKHKKRYSDVNPGFNSGSELFRATLTNIKMFIRSL